jgi:hypothetical protein
MSLTLTVILISRGLLGRRFFFDSLRDRLLGKIDWDLMVLVKGSFLTALIRAWKAENLVDAAFEFKSLGNDLNPVEEHESGLSLRKSFSFLGLC